MIHSLCPICKYPLQAAGNRAVCANGHSYDFAKEGYLNLLPCSKRHSQDPGDNKEMVAARKEFLSRGYYKPLADAVAEAVNQRFSDTAITVIDAGVGTGYYLNTLITSRCDIASASRAHACANNNIKTDADVYIGADVSKHAVRIAAKLNPQAECCVASVYDMPYPTACADAVLCIFSPHALSEYKRLLKPDGILIMATPDANHLIQLRRALYDDVRDVTTAVPTQGFNILYKNELQYDFTLKDSNDAAALLMMTPYAYRAPKQKTLSIPSAALSTHTAHFSLTVLCPQNN